MIYVLENSNKNGTKIPLSPHWGKGEILGLLHEREDRHGNAKP
jgi:hypothetical protein